MEHVTARGLYDSTGTIDTGISVNPPLFAVSFGFYFLVRVFARCSLEFRFASVRVVPLCRWELDLDAVLGNVYRWKCSYSIFIGLPWKQRLMIFIDR